MVALKLKVKLYTFYPEMISRIRLILKKNLSQQAKSTEKLRG